MKHRTAKQKAVDAIDAIVQAAKELAKAEQAYYQHKPRRRRKTGQPEPLGTILPDVMKNIDQRMQQSREGVHDDD